MQSETQSLLLQNASASGGNSVNPEQLLIPTTVMSDDHSKLAPLLPISNRTVKRLRANDSVHTYVKVGHRQTPYKQNAPPEMVGRFALVLVILAKAGIQQKHIFRETVNIAV